MGSEARQNVIGFCLEQAESVAVKRRVLLYRGLAEFCGDAAQAAQIQQLAADLEAADLKCREFAFAFSNQAAGAITNKKGGK